MTVENQRPQTARPNLGYDGHRKGSASPYNALPGNARALGLHVRPKTAVLQVAAGGTAEGRTMYVRAPRPPAGSLREYAPLRPRAQSSSQMQAGHGAGAWQDEREGMYRPQHDSLRDDARPMSARVTIGPSHPSRRPPPMSARGRMQSDGHDGGVGFGRVPSGGAHDSSKGMIYEDETGEHSDSAVAIFPAPNRPGFVPPQPRLQDPSPRRRPMSAHVPVTGEHVMPAITEPDDFPANGAHTLGEDVGRSRGALLKEFAPMLSAIASLTHETSLGKLARQIDAVVLLLLQADASRLALYNPSHQVLNVVRPGESDSQIQRSVHNQYDVEGITGICAEAATPINIADLHDNKDVSLQCDLGLTSLPETQQVSYLAVPARDKAGNVVAVISAMRLGLKANPFDDEAAEIMQLIARQAGVAVSFCQQRQEMQRAKMNNKILVKAAVELTNAPDLDIGSLIVLASIYAKKLADCDQAVICLSHDRNRLLRTWSMIDADANREPKDTAILAGDVRLEERSHIAVPISLKKVVTTGSVANMLLHGQAARPEHGELGHLNEPDLKTSSVIEGETLEFEIDSDSCLAVPLQSEPGASILGMIIATNRFGGPRRAGKSGLFKNQDEDALKELGSIVSAAIYKIMRVTDLESVIALTPTLTHHMHANLALDEVCKLAAKPLKADKLFVFTYEEDGNYLLHETGHATSNVSPPKRLQRGTSSRHHEVNKAPVKLSANSYPLAAAAQGRAALRVRINDVSDLIVHKKNGLLTHATDMLACPIRDDQGNFYGAIIVATQKQDTFPEYCVSLLSNFSMQVGAVLKRCGDHKQSASHVRALKNASREMLNIVNRREVKNVLDHVDSHVSAFMCCSRAVLYIVDRQQNVVWTAMKGGESEECMVTYDIKSDVRPDTEGSRVGYVNAVLFDGRAVSIKDFAYGQNAYNDMLDSADIKHVQKLLKLQSGAYDAATTALMRAELEPEQRTESIAAVPVHDSDGEIIAILQVMNRLKSLNGRKLRKEGFDADDVDKLELVAAAVSSTLETAARLNRQWEREYELRYIIDSANAGLKVGMGATCRVNLNDALSYVAKSAYNSCGASQVAVYLLDDEGEMDVVRFEGNLFVPCKRVKACVEGIAGLVITSGQKLNIAQANQHPHFKAQVDEKALLPVASMVACPIKDPNGRIVGALAFQNKKISHKTINDTDPFRAHGTHSARKSVMMLGHDTGWQQFDKCDERVLEAAAQGIGVALMQFILFDNISNVSERLKDISLELELGRTCDSIAESCKALCKASHCVVFLLDDKTGDMVCTHHLGSTSFRIPGTYGLPGAVRKRGGTKFCNSKADLEEQETADGILLSQRLGGIATDSAAQTDQYDREYTGLWNAMGVPMVNSEGRIVGVLEIGNKVGRKPFTPQDERLIRVIASHAYTCIRHCLTYEATASKVESNKNILHRVVGLVREVATTLPQTLEFASAYQEIVIATCLVMGVSCGHLYVEIPGSHRQWMAYDIDGKQIKERMSQTGARVLECGTLINNTKLPNQVPSQPCDLTENPRWPETLKPSPRS